MTARPAVHVPRRLALSAVVALGLALAAPAAWAQPDTAASSSDAANPSGSDAASQSSPDATNQSGSDAAAQSSSDTANQGGPDAKDQTSSDTANQGASDAANPSDPGTVTVQGPHRRRAYDRPVTKAEAAAAAKDEEWREYHDSTPAPVPGNCPVPPDPSQGAGCGTLEQSQDYPGLRNYVPQ